ncbi:MAG: hypothetical protein U5N86_11065 [Planctomycetota bacterium]|nr:hypothetical protein [Planctomycetota bacterium]
MEHIRDDLRAKYAELLQRYDRGVDKKMVCNALAAICEDSGAFSEAAEWHIKAGQADEQAKEEERTYVTATVDDEKPLTLENIISDAITYPVRKNGWVATVFGSITAAVCLKLGIATGLLGLFMVLLVYITFFAYLSLILHTSITGYEKMPSFFEHFGDFSSEIMFPGLAAIIIFFYYAIPPFVLVAIFGSPDMHWLGFVAVIFYIVLMFPAALATTVFRGFGSALVPLFPIYLMILIGPIYFVTTVLMMFTYVVALFMSGTAISPFAALGPPFNVIAFAFTMLINFYLMFAFFRLYGLVIRKKGDKFGM